MTPLDRGSWFCDNGSRSITISGNRKKMRRVKFQLASPTAQQHQKGEHEKCKRCGKQMCFYYHSFGEWVCFMSGICEDCYLKAFKK